LFSKLYIAEEVPAEVSAYTSSPVLVKVFQEVFI
jgi:hypothetical protein